MEKKKAKKPGSELPLGDGVGVGRVSIPELDDLASEYRRIRDRRQDLTEKEVKAKKALMAGVKAHEEEIGRNPDDHALRYVYDDQQSKTGRSVVELKPTDENVKVKDYEDPGAPE